MPDISGFTEFVQSTEVEHSQHVISELLEILVEANTTELQLAEVEGDALFFYKEDIPSQEMILAQVEHMFSAFYSHLQLLEKNRICPCNACLTAPKLQLKIVAHAGEMQFITVQGKAKPFGTVVIEVHRLMKNAVDSDNYVLLSSSLSEELNMADDYSSKLYQFEKGHNAYDGKVIEYIYSRIDNGKLRLSPFPEGKKIQFDKKPDVVQQYTFQVSSEVLMEYITSYGNRHEWMEGVDEFIYNESEVTRIGSPHVCVINGKSLDFVVVMKEAKPNQLAYGELTTSPGVVDKMYQFYTISPKGENECQLTFETYFEAKSIWKKIIIQLAVKKVIAKTSAKNFTKLQSVIKELQLNK